MRILEAARVLGLSPDRVRRYIRDGYIEADHGDNEWNLDVSAEELDRFLRDVVPVMRHKEPVEVPETPTVWRVNEVGELYDVEPATVRKWIYDGVLPARKVGSEWSIRRKDLIRFRPRRRGRPFAYGVKEGESL